VVEEPQHHPARVRRIVSDEDSHDGRLMQIEAVAPWIEA
jgi:hypothetical protein